MWAVREDDASWPKKNVVGRQELEIRLGNDHISFEVRRAIAPPLFLLRELTPSALLRPPRSARWSMSKLQMTRKVSVSFTTSSKISG
jgi:hypothetical protein